MKIALKDIVPYSKNAKKHPKAQVKKLAASIKEFGFNQPVVVDKDNVLIAGHGRCEAAKLLGLKEVPAIRTNNLTEEQVKSYRLADNKLAESDWEMELVIEELKDLDTHLQDLTGFNIEELEPQEIKEDEVPEIPKEPKSKLGDLYILGNHRILCGDATKIEDVERLMDGKKADMVFTDPPYGIDYQDTKGKHDKIINDAESPTSLVYEAVNPFLYAPRYICCNWKCMQEMVDALPDAKACIVWDKGSRIQNLDKFAKRHEFIIYAGPFGGEKTLDDDVWQIKREVRQDHPTSKPVELCARAIGFSSESGGNVADPFLGSGSTLIACEQTGRKCYGMELDPKYIDVIVERWETFTGKKAEKI